MTTTRKPVKCGTCLHGKIAPVDHPCAGCLGMEKLPMWEPLLPAPGTVRAGAAVTLVEEDLWPMLMSAIRYSFWRKSGTAALVRLWCRRYKALLHPSQREQIASEIREEMRLACAIGTTLGSKSDEDELLHAAEEITR